MKAVILAGGKGTRLSSALPNLPKPMAPVGGVPVLEHQIRLLKTYGIQDIIIITGFEATVIENYFKRGGSFGVAIRYYREPQPLGTTGGIKEIASFLTEDFIVLYGDVMVNMDLQRLINFHLNQGSDCTLVLHANDHPFDSDLVEIDETCQIVNFHPKPHALGSYHKNLVNAGIYVISPKVLQYIQQRVAADFGRDLFPRLVHKVKMYGYVTAEYLKDIGTPERLQEVNRDKERGIIDQQHRKNKRPAIFLDRDGIINREVGLLHNINDFELQPDAASAIKKINESGYLTIVVTNQSVVARNLCSITELETIHNKMETLLGNQRAKLDAIYYCPHHPDAGYPGENAAYKIDCSCRKPKTGLITKAVQEFNIDVDRSFIIGDSWRDIVCGRSAGLVTVGVMTGHGCKDSDIEPDYFFESLSEAVQFIVEDPYKEYFSQIYAAFLKSAKKKPFVISIGGNTRSGKTILAEYLYQQFSKLGYKVVHIVLDNWLVPEELRKPNETVFQRFQIDKIEKDLQKFFQGALITIKKYNKLSRTATDKTLQYFLDENDLVIVEGVVALSSEQLRNFASLKIFCSIDNTLLAERMERFYHWKGLNKDAIQKLFASRMADEYSLIDSDSRWGDIVIKAEDVNK